MVSFLSVCSLVVLMAAGSSAAHIAMRVKIVKISTRMARGEINGSFFFFLEIDTFRVARRDNLAVDRK